MGLGEAVYQTRTRADTVTFLRDGRRPVELDEQLLTEGVAAEHVELMRGDLVRLVHDAGNEAGQDDIEYLFGDTITGLSEDGDEVAVTFRYAAARTFDLVVGADGLHSVTRELTFGPEDRFLHFLGAHLAVFSVPNDLGLKGRSVVYAEVDRVAELYAAPGTDQLRVLLLFRTEQEKIHRDDLAAQRRFVRHAYAGAGWKLPGLLSAMESADDFYLDSVSQVQLPHWTAGRVALVGDAGYSTAPAVGGGTSLAVLGAYHLAASLAAADTVEAGLADYQRALAPAVRVGMSIAPRALTTLIARSAAQGWVMAQAVRLLPRLPRPVRRRLTSFGGGPADMLTQIHLPDPAPLLRAARTEPTRRTNQETTT